MQVITHPTSPYRICDIWEKTQVGFAEYNKPPLEQINFNTQTKDQQQEIVDQKTMADPYWPMWDWQSRCDCGRVRETEKMTNGKCEICSKEMQNATAG